MIPDKLSENDVQNIIQAMNQSFQAQLQYANSGAPFEVKKLTIDLTTAQLETAPLKIGFAFTSLYVVSASDTSSNVQMKVDTRDSYQDSFDLFKKDSLEFPGPKKEAYIYWEAQANKTMEILFFVTGRFKPGSNVTEISSSVGANSRSLVTPVSVLTTETALLSLDLNRKKATIFNDGTGTIYLGPTGVTTANGIPVAPGQFAYDSNTAALYAIASVAGQSTRIQVES